MRLFLFLLPFLPTYALAAASCNGELSLPGGFVNGNCSGGSCSAFLANESAGATAECSGGVTANVQANVQGGFVSGTCSGGSLSMMLPSSSVMLEGSCSTGSSFSGSAQASGGYANGSCSPNGSFSIFVSARTVPFQGGCE